MEVEIAVAVGGSRFFLNRLLFGCQGLLLRAGSYEHEWIGWLHRNLSLRPDVMPIAVGTERLRLKVREALKASPVGLDAGLDEMAGSGALDHELEHEHEHAP
jgi:hypothetical protein